jgi:hypothetical protein
MNATLAQRSAPAAFADTSDPRMSSRYVHIDTKQVIATMVSNGWEVARIRQDATRKRDPMFAKHEVDFRRAGSKADRRSIIPRVLWVNSHNGTSRGHFRLGVFRKICTNGMVVGSVWAQEAQRHVGLEAADILARISKAAAGTARLMDTIEKWEHTAIPRATQIEFAKAASKIRYGDESRYPAETLLAARRPADEGDSMWLVFNRLQENLTHGGFDGQTVSGRAITARPIASINNELNFNQRLWLAAEEIVGGKA